MSSAIPTPPRTGSMPRVAILGSGFSGLCLAIQLKKAGIDSFTIFEKASRIGGTWRDNTYPGAACDSPSFAYCFSFEQKTDWSRKWAHQDEILAYMDQCAEKYGLKPHVRFETEISEARFDDEVGVWQLRSADGEEIVADVLVSGVGQLNRPYTPKLAGLERFEGRVFHSACWDHDYDLTGKRVAVIGNAASAVQFVPEIAKQVAKLSVFQRSANWMLPKLDREYREEEKRRFARHPWLAKLYRWWIWASFELRFPVFLRQRFMSRRIEELAIRAVREQVRDPALQEALIPDYPIGGKRILISDDYYATLEEQHVELVTEPIDHLDESTVVTGDGFSRAVDAVIFATGFETTRFLAPMAIQGRAGRRLESEWRDGPRAYLGMTTAGFPNFFMMYGPNTNLGHNSIIFMIECQARYIVDCIRQIITRNLLYIDLRRDVMDAFNVELQRELQRTAWAATGKSWYKNEAGVITNNWSGTTTRYWWRTRKADLDRYHKARRPGR
jgi:cation diffusion facilitator CzcD-associated flavoprotein CzcO